MIANEISPTSWILSSDVGERLGLLVKKESSYEIFSLTDTQKFDTIGDIGEIIFKDKQIDDREMTVMGYPTGQTSIFIIEDDLPMFKKSERSKTIFLAGYWKVDGKIVLCPKVDTLSDKEDIDGPFKDKFMASL